KSQLPTHLPTFPSRHTLPLHLTILQASPQPIQLFQPLLIKPPPRRISQTFTLPKISSPLPLQTTFPLHTPKIQQITRLLPQK
ncbi:50S ribosomal protein L19, partial [Staphylococcus epidermidis]|uniref:50S ribosomal protein L19 n=1 Tax=Staphylococcus epidermidis TaxID=1282 RepID=UPI0011A42D93